MDCVFCKIINKEIPSDIVYEDDAVVVFVDIRPTTPGHLLIVPKEHSENMLDASAHALDGMLAAVKKLVPAALTASGSEGWNLHVNNGPAAGQVVMHTHWHVIPRRSDDGLRHWPAIPMSAEDLAKMADSIRKKL